VPTFATGRVVEILDERTGIQRCAVLLDGDDAPSRAVNLTSLTGDVAVGDDVVCNTTAVGLELGTGGWHFVHWNLRHRELDIAGGGHIMKLRYTSLQTDTGAAEEPGGALALEVARLEAAGGVGGMPVVAASLHSLVAAVCAGIAATDRALQIAYVMTDGAALPIALSDLVVQLRDADLVRHTVTVGNAFGGDHEAVTVASGVLAARACGADVAVVAMGPGVVGTGTRFGTTAFEVAGIVQAARAVGGRPVVTVRCSDADPRDRHRGVSHHTAGVLAGCGGADVVVPAFGDDDGTLLATDLTAHLHGAPVEVVRVDPGDPVALLADAGLQVSSMGRAPADDPLFWAAGVAAGVHAAGLARTGGG
jgi:hypothetical protein